MGLTVRDSEFIEEGDRAPIRAGLPSSVSIWSCPNSECPDYERKAGTNIMVAKIYGKRHIRLLRCRTCQTTFSERRFSPFYGTHADESLITEAMFHLALGKSIRKVARMLGVDKDTICRWMDKAALATDEVRAFLADSQIGESDLANFIAMLDRRR